MEKLRKIALADGQIFLTEMTKKQREILQALNLCTWAFREVRFEVSYAFFAIALCSCSHLIVVLLKRCLSECLSWYLLVSTRNSEYPFILHQYGAICPTLNQICLTSWTRHIGLDDLWPQVSTRRIPWILPGFSWFLWKSTYQANPCEFQGSGRSSPCFVSTWACIEKYSPGRGPGRL